jgi:hypothetical protein
VTATQTADLISGTAVSASVTATAAGATPPPSKPPPAGPPATLRNLTPPTITGTAKENGTLTCHPGTWTVPGATYQYEWEWTGDNGRSLTKLNPKLKSVGIKPSRLNGLLKSRVFTTKFNFLAHTATIIVPALTAPTQFYCTVIASATKQLPVAATSHTLSINPDPPGLTRSRKTLKTTPPHINPHVGVSGTNTCQPGLWTGDPKFTYTWYRVARDRRNVSGYSFTSLATGSSYQLIPADEKTMIECWVTGSNRYGTDTERSNQYLVPLGAPKQTGEVQVAAQTLLPSGGGRFGSAGGSVTAEQVKLTCEPGQWNRADLTFSYNWTVPDDVWIPYEQPESGQTLTFDMRPGHLQYQFLRVQCNVTATTNHHISSTAHSGLVVVSNGCQEAYTLSDLNDYNINPFQNFYFTFEWLHAEGDSHGDVEGLFEYYGNVVPAGTMPHRAVTSGPNCSDYGNYLHNLGFDVKQDDPNDPQWVDH